MSLETGKFIIKFSQSKFWMINRLTVKIYSLKNLLTNTVSFSKVLTQTITIYPGSDI